MSMHMMSFFFAKTRLHMEAWIIFNSKVHNCILNDCGWNKCEKPLMNIVSLVRILVIMEWSI
jgi:hypothetical protein